jgi:hypothetical protein
MELKMVNEVVSSLGSNESVSVAFDGGTSTAASLTLEQVATSGSVVVQSPGEETAVAISKEVLENLGDAVMVLTTFNGSDHLGMSEDGAVLRTAPVSIRLFMKDSTDEFSGPFPAGLRIRFAITADQQQNESDSENQLVCAYWDVAQERWMTEGVETETGSDGNVWCKTVHLTLFAMS